MKIECLVDNTVQQGSRLWGEHGLAFVIESDAGRLLFDTGASGIVLLHNLEAASVATDSIGALAISHAHRDHSGGLPALLERRPGLPLYANADLLRERYARRDGSSAPTSIGLTIDPASLAGKAELHLSFHPQQVMSGIWTTGEIAMRAEPLGSSPSHVIREGEAWVPDAYRDDMALVLDTASGPVLVCGCCHAGLLNTLAHVKRVFGVSPSTVVGGTHLVSADARHLAHVVEALQRQDPPALFLNHCTGPAAYVALAVAFGDRVAPCPAGTVLEF